MLLKSVCSSDKKNHSQSIFILFSELVVIYTIFSVFVCKEKIINNSEKKMTTFFDLLHQFSYIFVAEYCLINTILKL